MKPRLKGALLLLLAFALGAVAGGLGYRAYLERGASWRGELRAERFEQSMLRRLTRELELKSDQQARLETVLQEAGQEFRKLRGEIAPRFRALRGKTEERIRELLDPEQQARFAELVKRWEQRIERWRSREAGAAGAERTLP